MSASHARMASARGEPYLQLFFRGRLPLNLAACRSPHGHEAEGHEEGHEGGGRLTDYTHHREASGSGTLTGKMT